MVKSRLSLSVLFIFCSPLFLLAQLPAGFVGRYTLANSASDNSGNSNNGTMVSATAATDRFGTASAATSFTSGSSYGSLPNVVQDNFTIGFWFKTTITALNGVQWYSGNSLVNAEVCGAANDWGTSLMNTGKVCMGIGNPDMTISSTANYNDGNWHFVTAVRDETGGVITLYVDGTQAATQNGTSMTPRDAPGAIGLGRDASFFTPSCGAGTAPNYTGSLDDIIVYNRVLTSTEVTNLYNYMAATPLPLNWLSFTGGLSGNGVELDWRVGDVVNNDHFDIERSTDGVSFSSVGQLANNTGEGMEATSYSFVDDNPQDGTDYYRIKQVDKDGNYTWSKTISIKFQNPGRGITLSPNPVHGDPSLLNPGQQFIRELRVMDPSGKQLRKQAVNGENSSIVVDTHTLSPGYYLVQVVGAGGAKMVLPLVKM